MSGRNVPVTAVVVSCDEADLLRRSLPALTFAEELIVVDMECTDDSAGVAAACGAQVLAHPRVRVIEAAQRWLAGIAAHDWVLVCDPDEVVDAGLARAITALLPDLPEDVASIDIPTQYYFGRHPLRGTYWGGRKWKSGCLFHRHRVRLDNIVHRRAEPLPGFVAHRLPWAEDGLLRHYWMRDYAQFVLKHRRYLPAEGERHRGLGRRFSWPRLAWAAAHSFVWSLVKKRAWRDGHVGIGLSAFYAWYVSAGWLALARLEKEAARP